MEREEQAALVGRSEFSPREIEVFAAVMLHGTTTKAADALDVTQPAVSKTLHLLAEKAGFQLFRKTRQRLVPTPEAHMLYAEVQRVFESARAISLAAQEIRELRSGRLTLCSMPAFGLTLLPHLVAEFSRTHPTVSIALDIRSSATVIQRASRNQLDIGIAVTAQEDVPSVSRRALVDTEPVCVMPLGHPLARADVVECGDLDGLDFVAMGTADPLRRQLDPLCEAQGVQRRQRVEVSLSAACLDLVANGAGVAIVDRLSAWLARDKGIVIRPFRPRLDLKISLYRPWGVIASTASDSFHDMLIQNTRSYMKIVDDAIARGDTG